MCVNFQFSCVKFRGAHIRRLSQRSPRPGACAIPACVRSQGGRFAALEIAFGRSGKSACASAAFILSRCSDKGHYLLVAYGPIALKAIRSRGVSSMNVGHASGGCVGHASLPLRGLRLRSRASAFRMKGAGFLPRLRSAGRCKRCCSSVRLDTLVSLRLYVPDG